MQPISEPPNVSFHKKPHRASKFYLVLGIFVAVTSLAGCQKNIPPKTTDATEEKITYTVQGEFINKDFEDLDEKTQATLKEIVDIAKQETTKRGWSGPSEIYVDKTEEGWDVLIQRLPKARGNHAMVIISSDKKTVKYLPGK